MNFLYIIGGNLCPYVCSLQRDWMEEDSLGLLAVSGVKWQKNRLYENNQGNGENLHGCGNVGSFATEQLNMAGSPTDPSGVFKMTSYVGSQNICFETCHEKFRSLL
jgi:hypothetical protein